MKRSIESDSTELTDKHSIDIIIILVVHAHMHCPCSGTMHG